MTRSDSIGRKGVKSRVGNQEYLSGIVNGKAVSSLAGDDEEPRSAMGRSPLGAVYHYLPVYHPLPSLQRWVRPVEACS